MYCVDTDLPYKPHRLRRGDTVGIVSTSFSVVTDGSEEAVRSAIVEKFATLGLNVKFAKNWYTDINAPFSGTPEQRREDLMSMFEDPNVHAIMATKGGRGAVDVVPLLDYDIIRKNPKPYIGLSDPTIVHMALQSRTNMLTMYIPNALTVWTEKMKHWMSCILMQSRAITFNNPGTRTIIRGKSIGRLLGGILALVYITPFTGYGYNLDDPYILFFEEVGVIDGTLERRLKAMDRSGIFKNAKGLVFGDCVRCSENHFKIDQVVRNVWKKYPHVPSYTGANITHDEGSFTLPMNILYEIDSGKGQLKMLESFVR